MPVEKLRRLCKAIVEEDDPETLTRLIAELTEHLQQPGGPTQIVENIILSRDGNHYAGTFTLDAYDTPSNGNKLLVHIIGVITATRITVDTSVNSVF